MGKLIKGNSKISSKWKGIIGSKYKFTIHDNSIVAISGNQWTELGLNGEFVKNGLILDTRESVEEVEDFMRGAIIRLKDELYAKVIYGTVIFFIKDKNVWIKTRPIPVTKNELNFPPNINAGFESIDGYFYFIKNDKFCKRKLNDKDGVSFEILFY